MKISGVDNELCTACGACVEECAAALFRFQADPSGAAVRVIHQDPHGCGRLCRPVSTGFSIPQDSWKGSKT